MASEIRAEDPDVAAGSPPPGREPGPGVDELTELLRSEPWSFSFFQAVRLLKRALPERAAVGHFADPASETVRFLQHPSLAFPASEIQDLAWAEGQMPKMMVNFMGLIGPSGVLPLHYTELALERLRARDRTFLDFLNLFHHRLTSGFYRAWEKHRFAIAYEQDRDDLLTRRLYDLVGLGTSTLRNRQPFDDEVFACFSGLFAMVARSAASLESLLAGYFEVPVAVEQFIGVWRSLEECDQCGFEFELSNSVQLGAGAVVGDEIWDRQSRARIILGPLTADRYREFLPGGSGFKALQSLTRMFSGNDIEYELQLMLKREYVPGCQLGCDEEAGIQLGWFTWLKSRPTFDRDPGDTIALLT